MLWLRRKARRAALAAKRVGWRRSATARMLRRPMTRKARYLSLPAAGLALGLALGLAHRVMADKPAAGAARPDVPWQDARLLAEVLERVEREYVEPVDDHQLLQAAIRGMVSSLDPYSAYLDGEEYDEIKISSSGQYSGVGHRSVDGGWPGRGGGAFRRIAGRRSGNPHRRRHRDHRRRGRQYHHAGRHHRPHARQGGYLGQDRDPARGQSPNRCNSRSSARAFNCTA